MNTYTCEFFGRPIGAIGITYHDVIEVKANSIKEAILKIYDTHEHITKLSINSQKYLLDGTPI